MQVDTFTLGRSTSVSEGFAGADDGDHVQARIAAGTEHLSALREEYLRSLARGLRLQYRRVESVGDLGSGTRTCRFRDRARVPRPISGRLLAVAAALLVAGSYVFPLWRRRNGLSGVVTRSRH